jgi:hypothetical protein
VWHCGEDDVVDLVAGHRERLVHFALIQPVLDTGEWASAIKRMAICFSDRMRYIQLTDIRSEYVLHLMQMVGRSWWIV